MAQVGRADGLVEELVRLGVGDVERPQLLLRITAPSARPPHLDAEQRIQAFQLGKNVLKGRGVVIHRRSPAQL